MSILIILGIIFVAVFLGMPVAFSFIFGTIPERTTATAT